MVLLVVVALSIRLLPLMTVLNAISSVESVPSTVELSVYTVVSPALFIAAITEPVLNPPVVCSST